MERRNRYTLLSVTTLAVTMLIGCGGGSRNVTVTVPPRVDLKAYNTIGIIEFSSNDQQADLQQFTTQRFVQTMQSSQPGVRVLELGSEERVLASVNHQELDVDAIAAIRKKYRVDALVTGDLDISQVKPKVRLSTSLTSLKSLSAQANVEASLSARLIETQSGATLWTNSARETASVAHVNLASAGGNFGAGSPEDAYGSLLQGLVTRTTHDFRPTYEQRRIPK